MSKSGVLSRIGVFVLVAALAACGGGGGEDAGAGGCSGGSGGGGSGGGATPGDQYGSAPDPVAAPSGSPTSAEVINAALGAGTISKEQALTYKIFADFGDPRLPAPFQGDDGGHIEGEAHHEVLAHIAAVGIANVSTTTLDLLRPFFVPAFYEGSWWHQRSPGATAKTAAAPEGRARAASHQFAAAANPNCRAWETECALLADWKSVGGANVVVWYLAANEATDASRATMLRDEFETAIWPKLTGLMGHTPKNDVGTGLVTAEKDGRLDVMLVDMPADKQGSTLPSTIIGCKAVPAHIYLNRNLPNRGLIAQAAHEFMHVIQFSIEVKAQCLEAYYTIQEATAVWATNYVYPKNDWEHSYAMHYLTNQWVSESYDYRPPKPSLFRYGAYVFPLFLETRFGPSIVKGIWDKTIDFNQELFAIDSAIGDAGSSSHKEWPKFIAANWNRDTINTYFKADILVENVDLTGTDTLNLSAGMGSVSHPVSMKHASAAYYRVLFGGNDSRSITIVNGLSFKAESVDLTGWGNNLAFTGLNALQRQGASLQVYLKVNGAWLSGPTNLTNVPWFTVCRDDPAGRIEEMIFIYGNAEISESAPNYTSLEARAAPPGVLATNIGCRDWTGSLSMTKPMRGGSETLNVSGMTLKNMLPTATPEPGDGPSVYPFAPGEQIAPGFGWVYAITAGNAVWNCNVTADGCTNTGSKSFSIGKPTPTITNSGYTPAGRAKHGIIIPGFLTNALPAVVGLSYEWRCVDSQGQVTTGTDVNGTELDVHVRIDDPGVRISTGTGLSVGGTGAQSGAAPDANGSWSLQGQTN